MIEIHDNEVKQECGICNHITKIKLTESELEAYRRYLRGGLFIQECLPTLNRAEREFLKSSYCVKCQKLLFDDGDTERLY